MKENVQSGAAAIEYFIGAGLNLTEYLPVILFLGIVTVADEADEVGEVEGRAEDEVVVGGLDAEGLIETRGENDGEIEGESEGESDCDSVGLNTINGVPSKRYSCPMLLEGNEEIGIFTDMKGPTKLKLKSKLKSKLKAQIKS